MILFPVTGEVRRLEELIKEGDLDDIKKFASRIPPKHLVSMMMSQGYTPLIIAVDSRRRDIVNYFLDLGADVNQYCKNETALHRAIFRNDKGIIHDLIERGANMEAKISRSGITPCIYSIIRGQAKVLDLLLEMGASLDYKINSKVVNDELKRCESGISKVHFKHERWRRVRKLLKF